MTQAPPKWVIDQLITDGDLTPDKHTRKPQRRRCPACGVHVTAAIRAMTNEVVRADLAPTTSEGELIALMNGRRTFLVTDFYGIELRFEFDITGLPADRARQVHAEHRCHAPPLPAHPEYRPPIRHTTKDDTNIPF